MKTLAKINQLVFKVLQDLGSVQTICSTRIQEESCSLACSLDSHLRAQFGAKYWWLQYSDQTMFCAIPPNCFMKFQFLIPELYNQQGHGQS